VSVPVSVTLAALIAVGAVFFVAQPFFRRRRPDVREPQPALSPRLALLERRDRALAALKELEFDHRTGKISDDDYRALLSPLRREAAETLRGVAVVDVRTEPKARAKKRHLQAAAGVEARR
jgi:hypothetical protein